MNYTFMQEVKQGFDEYLEKFGDNLPKDQRNTLWAFYLEGYHAGLGKAKEVADFTLKGTKNESHS
jgi:hypothetical protein